MQDKRTLYIIGGPAKVGKSAVTGKIKERGSSIRPSPNDLCRPLVKNLFVKEIPENADTLAFKGIVTIRPQNADETKTFDLSFPLSSATAPMFQKDALIELPTDWIRTVIRLVFIGGNYGLGAIAFEGTTTYLTSDKKEIANEPIAIPIKGEDDNAWNALVGLIHDYDRENQNDVIVEGVAVTPEWANELKLNNFCKKVIFIGYSNAELYVQRRIAYAKDVRDSEPNNYDWAPIQEKGEERHTQDLLREAREQVPRNATLKTRAEGFDFPYFDLTEKSFDAHVRAVIDSLWPPQKI